jgi:hypothetical protein
MSAAQQDDDIYKAETDPPPPGEDDAYAAPTRVGPMSNAAIAKLMVEAEKSAAPPRSTTSSGIRAALRLSEPPSSGLRSFPPPALPSLSFEEDTFDPTVLNERGWKPPANIATVGTAQTRSIVDAIVEEMESTVLEADDDDADTQGQVRASAVAHADVSGAMRAGEVKPDALLVPADSAIASLRRPPPKAAFPEWIGITWRSELYREKPDRTFVFRLAAGGAAFMVVAAILIWWLF